MSKHVGLLLFAHGSRDPSWAEPFRQLLTVVRMREPGVLCELAFLEANPNLHEGASVLKEKGAETIDVIPLFLSRGTHLREDLPEIVSAASGMLGIPISVRAAIGEDERMIAALADWILAAREPDL
jgi:sirohydrochlorin cobaltochelatase